MTTFSVHLQQARQMRGFSRQEMADVLGITVRSYQYYEEGKREPDFEKLVALAKHLKVSSDYLLGLTD